MTDRLAYFTSSLLLEKEREKKKAQICFIKFASSNEVPLPVFSSFFFSSLKFIPRRMTRRTLHQNKIILQEFFIGESSPLAILIPGQFSLSPRSPKVYYITTRELHYLSTFSYPDL